MLREVARPGGRPLFFVAISHLRKTDMADPKFIHLRFHSEYSVTDGLVRIDPMIHKVLETGGVAVGIADLMNIFGGLRFYTHALAAGLKPILGCDLRVKNLKEPDAPTRLGVLCMNHTGYHSLCVLLTKAFLTEDDKFRGQIDPAWFAEGGADGLIALTGGAEGELGRYLINKRFNLADQAVEELKAIFGDRLYIEVQRAGRPNDELATARLANLAAEHGLPVVATHPVQFIEKSDFEAHEVRCAIAEGFSLQDPRRSKNYSPEQYLKSEEEMCELFADMPSALRNSVEIAKRCNLDGVLSKPQLPLFPTPDGMSLDDYIEQLSREGLQKRLDFLYPDKVLQNEKRPAYDERLTYELDIIKGMKFPGYFLIVQDFINWSKRNGIPVGPGRGSGAGSLVAYSLGITDLDPLKFDLLFERFLNPERVSMPDFDVDFCQYNRDRTIEYVKRTYGVDAVSQIATFGTMGAKAAVRDVGRALDVPYMKTDALSKLIPQQPGKNITLDDALRDVPEFREAVERDDEYKEILRLAKPLEGLTRNLGMHAGGVLIAPGKLTDFCPLYNADGAPENTVSQFDKKDVENVGLVKFDFLGLTTLSILAKAVEYIDQLHPGTHFELDHIPIDDEPTYRLFQEANTAAIFQFESDGMRSLLKQARPDRLEDLVALNALYRPGPMDLIPSFIARKFGREKVEYLDERMEPVLRETYGIMVYQEQVMRVAQVVGGYSLGGADLLRRAMGKKNVEEMKRQRAVFVKGAAERNVKEEVASEIFDLMEKFAGYGFNKSHAAAYSYVAYQTAYLKAHHTAAFMAANLCMVMDSGEKMKALIDDAIANGVELLMPDINASDWFFTVPDEKHIRFGLGGIKGVSQAVIQDLVEKRKKDGLYLDIFDVAARVTGANARLLEALVKAGCFDSIDPDRNKLIVNIPQALSASQSLRASAGQESLFDEPGETARIVSWLPAVPWTMRQKLTEEKSVLGYWLTGHMFDQYREELAHYSRQRLKDLQPSREPVKMTGIVTSVRQVQSKRGRMGIVTIDDGTAVVEAMCFSEFWEKNRRVFQVDGVVCLTGKVRYDEFSKRMSVTLESVKTLDQFRHGAAKHLKIRVKPGTNAQTLAQIEELLRQESGESGVPLVLETTAAGVTGSVFAEQQVHGTENFMAALLAVPAVESMQVVY